MKGANDSDDGEPYAVIVADSYSESHVVPMQQVPDTFIEEVQPAPVLPLRNVSGFRTVLESKEKLRFLLDSILPHTGMMFIGGLSGTGKTIMAIQTVANMVQGKNTMSWRLSDDAGEIRCLFLSLEMGQHELQARQRDMGYHKYSDEELDFLEEHLKIYRESEPFRLWMPEDVRDLILLISKYEANLVLIDSASVSLADSLLDDTQVNKSLANLRMIRMQLEVAMIVVAHTRKPPSGNVYNPEDVTINDLFGHSGVAQHASSIWILTEDQKQRAKTVKSETGSSTEKLVHFINVKNRFGASNAAFTARLTSMDSVENGEPLMFRRDAIPLPPMTEDQKKRLKSNTPTLAQALKEFDFKSVAKDDE